MRRLDLFAFAVLGDKLALFLTLGFIVRWRLGRHAPVKRVRKPVFLHCLQHGDRHYFLHALVPLLLHTPGLTGWLAGWQLRRP